MGMMKRLIEDAAEELSRAIVSGDTKELIEFLTDLGGDDTDKLYLVLEGLRMTRLIGDTCETCGVTNE